MRFAGAHRLMGGPAVVLQVVSVIAVSVWQRQLLAALGTHRPVSAYGRDHLANTPVSLTVPAGGAVGADWSFGRYRKFGASPAVASSVTVASGARPRGGAGPVELMGTADRQDVDRVVGEQIIYQSRSSPLPRGHGRGHVREAVRDDDAGRGGSAGRGHQRAIRVSDRSSQRPVDDRVARVMSENWSPNCLLEVRFEPMDHC